MYIEPEKKQDKFLISLTSVKNVCPRKPSLECCRPNVSSNPCSAKHNQSTSLGLAHNQDVLLDWLDVARGFSYRLSKGTCPFSLSVDRAG